MANAEHAAVLRRADKAKVRVPIMAIRVPIIAVRVPIIAVRVPIIAVRPRCSCSVVPTRPRRVAARSCAGTECAHPVAVFGHAGERHGAPVWI